MFVKQAKKFVEHLCIYDTCCTMHIIYGINKKNISLLMQPFESGSGQTDRAHCVLCCTVKMSTSILYV